MDKGEPRWSRSKNIVERPKTEGREPTRGRERKCKRESLNGKERAKMDM